MDEGARSRGVAGSVGKRLRREGVSPAAALGSVGVTLQWVPLSGGAPEGGRGQTGSGQAGRVRVGLLPAGFRLPPTKGRGVQLLKRECSEVVFLKRDERRTYSTAPGRCLCMAAAGRHLNASDGS